MTKETFDRQTNGETVPPTAKSVSTAPAPFPFIVGCGRSGTTLMRSMLDSNSDMAVPPESHFVVPFLLSRHRYERGGQFDTDHFLDDLTGHWGFQRWRTSPALARECVGSAQPTDTADALRHAFRAYAMSQGKHRYGEKTPINVMSLKLLASSFPEAHFIHVIRDGRDVALSYVEQAFGPRSIPEAAEYWSRNVRRGLRSGRRLGSERYAEIQYENLIDHPKEILVDLCARLQLSYEVGMVRYFARPDLTDDIDRGDSKHRNLMLPPTPGLRDWRRELPAADRMVFEVIAGKALSQLGYERDQTRVPVFQVCRARSFWFSIQASRVANKARKVFTANRSQ